MSYSQAEPAPYPCAQLFILKMAVDVVSEQWEKQCQERLWVESESCVEKNFLQKSESVEASCRAKPTNKGKRLWHEYDCIVGIAFWPSRDPIGERGGLNLYAMVSNDSINWIDHFGLAPNQRETIDPDDLIMSAKSEINSRLSDNVECKDIDIDDVLDALKEKHSGQFRYVYADDYGWIDLRHFFEAANYAEDIGSVTTEVLGFGDELFQWLTEWGDDYRSGFSPEDIPSNSAGAKFGDDYDIENCCEFVEALEQFFDDHGGRNQKDSGTRWNELPRTDPSVRGGDGRGSSNPLPSNPNSSDDAVDNAINTARSRSGNS